MVSFIQSVFYRRFHCSWGKGSLNRHAFVSHNLGPSYSFTPCVTRYVKNMPYMAYVPSVGSMIRAA